MRADAAITICVMLPLSWVTHNHPASARYQQLRQPSPVHFKDANIKKAYHTSGDCNRNTYRRRPSSAPRACFSVSAASRRSDARRWGDSRSGISCADARASTAAFKNNTNVRYQNCSTMTQRSTLGVPKLLKFRSKDQRGRARVTPA